MKISNKVKKQIISNILHLVSGISDKLYQKKIWIRGEGPEVDDFEETCCGLFEDNNIDFVLENFNNYMITQNQYNVLKKFRDRFKTFSDENYWPANFIDSEDWTKITEMAKDVLKAFDYKKE